MVHGGGEQRDLDKAGRDYSYAIEVVRCLA